MLHYVPTVHYDIEKCKHKYIIILLCYCSIVWLRSPWRTEVLYYYYVHLQNAIWQIKVNGSRFVKRKLRTQPYRNSCRKLTCFKLIISVPLSSLKAHKINVDRNYIEIK